MIGAIVLTLVKSENPADKALPRKTPAGVKTGWSLSISSPGKGFRRAYGNRVEPLSDAGRHFVHHWVFGIFLNRKM